ncbi:endonuclease MutS2 [Soehngenia longivitae]|uniref:Endonuclease MutS2 n=1 Tax=Soehngenia longivitae TaxID=2562294 RepID=A0A4Z0D5Y4_9FIRM|nr:endonuclease MutS2 [Soehngenia longivitae]TFZ40280.1 endonuclease MutS2 [Soehngenia longivitae]
MNDKSLRVLEYEKIINKLKEQCITFLGKNLSDNLSPNTDLIKIQEMLDETEEAYKMILRIGRPPLSEIEQVDDYLKRAMIGGSLTPYGLIQISRVLKVSRELKTYILSQKENLKTEFTIFEELANQITVLKILEDKIGNAILSEDEISDNASVKLRDIRRKIRAKNDSIKDKLNSILNSLSNKKYLQDNIVTIRDGRYVIPVKAENKSSVAGIVHDVSSSGATTFIEPLAVVELNNEIRELEIEEQKEIERVLMELSQFVSQSVDLIKINQDTIAYLDFIFAKAKLAIDLDASKPELNKNGYLNFKKARHPLLEGNVVPIDVYIGDEFKTLVITGPNTGGKTVTLKTVGLLTLMGQSGLFIPASENSNLAVFDYVAADIGDEQSIEQNLSTFSSHMKNIVQILNEVKDNSLVLFDELGAGTDPVEGAALAMAILNELRSKEIRTIATTHYSQLKIYALTTEKVKNASMEFDVETLSPTYKLLIGLPGKSNAFEISKRLGLSDNIVENAKELMSKENIEFEEVLKSIDQDRKIIESEKIEIENLKKALKRMEKELLLERKKMLDEKEKIIIEAKQNALKVLDDANKQADDLVRQIREIFFELDREKQNKITEVKKDLSSKIDRLEQQIIEANKNVKHTKSIKKVKIGQTIKVNNINQIGTVLTLPDEKGNLDVQVGIMKINVNISELSSTDDDIINDQKSQKRLDKKTLTKAKNIKKELDLRGYDIENAIMEIDKYLDDAYLAGLNEVLIIHGKGTGVLREGIRSYLNKNKHVESIRYGEYNEGGDGVTVVKLK